MLPSGCWSPILTAIAIIGSISALPTALIEDHHQAIPVSVSSVALIQSTSSSFTSATSTIISAYASLPRASPPQASLLQTSLQHQHTIILTMKHVFGLIAVALASTSIPTAQAHPGHSQNGGDVTRNPDLVAKLRMAATAKDRAALLPKNEDWFFDFTAQPSYTYSPGSVVSANVAAFPAAVGHGLTVAMLSLGPCAMLAPHLHPRAANWVTAVEGTTKTWMIQENGVRPIEVVLKPGQMTIFPAGSLHTMQNMGCGNATLVSTLSSEDPGTMQLANAMWLLPPHMIQAAFGGNHDFSNTTDAGQNIPPVGTGSVIGSQECRTMCSMK